MNRGKSNKTIDPSPALPLGVSSKPIFAREQSSRSFQPVKNPSFNNVFIQHIGIIKPIVPTLSMLSPSSQSSSEGLSPSSQSSSSSSPQGSSPITKRPVLHPIPERQIILHTAANIQQQLEIQMVTTDIGKHARSIREGLKKSSLSAPVLTSSSIGITKTPYELSLHECYKEFLTIQYPALVSKSSSTKINIDLYNKIFVEFVLYTLYNVYKTQGSGENISEFYNIINSIDTYINEVKTIFSNIIRDLDSSDNFKNFLKIENLKLTTSEVQIIKPLASSIDNINELDILSYLLKNHKNFFVNIIKQEDSLKIFSENIENIDNILTIFKSNVTDKLKIYNQFSNELIINIFENINFRVIFKKINGIIMRTKIKNYYKNIKSYEDEDEAEAEADIDKKLHNYSLYIDIIQKVYYFFETLYFFYNITIHNLDTDDHNINKHKHKLDSDISTIQTKLLSLQSIYSRELTAQTTLGAITRGRLVIERLDKFGLNREDVTKSFDDLKYSVKDIDKHSSIRNPLIKFSDDLTKLKKSM
jgi:hypothetical protein